MTQNMDALRVTVQKTYESKKVLGDYDVDKMLNKAVAHVSTKKLGDATRQLERTIH